MPGVSPAGRRCAASPAEYASRSAAVCATPRLAVKQNPAYHLAPMARRHSNAAQVPGDSKALSYKVVFMKHLFVFTFGYSYRIPSNRMLSLINVNGMPITCIRPVRLGLARRTRSATSVPRRSESAAGIPRRYFFFGTNRIRTVRQPTGGSLATWLWIHSCSPCQPG